MAVLRVVTLFGTFCYLPSALPVRMQASLCGTISGVPSPSICLASGRGPLPSHRGYHFATLRGNSISEDVLGGVGLGPTKLVT
mmetsp:Transcript_79643/g.174644  ORF Transcript_79643/g.174644 Transcript_79643/m.174644 type:complete len:83 (-) Transcript_79643:21-269(-)